VAFLIFRLGRRLPMRTFLSVAVVLVMLTSVAFLGNAVHELQAADMIGYTALDWPHMPIFLAQATGYWPTVQTITAQLVLLAVYVLGAIYMFVIKPRRERAASPRTGGAVGAGPTGDDPDAEQAITVERQPEVVTIPAGGHAAASPGA